MPARSKISALPAAVKKWLEAALVQGNFSGYEALAEQLKAQGYEISKSALHREGLRMQETIADAKATTDAAILFVDQVGDAEDKRSEALLGMVQDKLFRAVQLLRRATTEDAEEQLAMLAKASKGLAEITRASALQKRFTAEARKAAQLEAAKAVDAVASTKGSGLSAETADAIKRAILGVGA